MKVSGLCQDGNTSSREITEVKHLELNQSSYGPPNFTGKTQALEQRAAEVTIHLLASLLGVAGSSPGRTSYPKNCPSSTGLAWKVDSLRVP